MRRAALFLAALAISAVAGGAALLAVSSLTIWQGCGIAAAGFALVWMAILWIADTQRAEGHHEGRYNRDRLAARS